LQQIRVKLKKGGGGGFLCISLDFYIRCVFQINETNAFFFGSGLFCAVSTS